MQNFKSFQYLFRYFGGVQSRLRLVRHISAQVSVPDELHGDEDLTIAVVPAKELNKQVAMLEDPI